MLNCSFFLGEVRGQTALLSEVRLFTVLKQMIADF